MQCLAAAHVRLPDLATDLRLTYPLVRRGLNPNPYPNPDPDPNPNPYVSPLIW